MQINVLWTIWSIGKFIDIYSQNLRNIGLQGFIAGPSGITTSKSN